MTARPDRSARAVAARLLLASVLALAPAVQADGLGDRERPAFDALVNTLAPVAATLDWPALLQATATHPTLLGARYEAP